MSDGYDKDTLETSDDVFQDLANRYICKIKERIESNRRTAKHNHDMGMFSEEREANARADGYGIALDIFKDTFGVL
jgi:hypothetical protein